MDYSLGRTPDLVQSGIELVTLMCHNVAYCRRDVGDSGVLVAFVTNGKFFSKITIRYGSLCRDVLGVIEGNVLVDIAVASEPSRWWRGFCMTQSVNRRFFFDDISITPHTVVIESGAGRVGGNKIGDRMI